MATLAFTAALIATSWLVYVWAVLNGHVLEGSLGYYLNPLVNVLLGVVLLKDRLTGAQDFAVGLASAEIGRAAGRERECQDGDLTVADGPLKQNKHKKTQD